MSAARDALEAAQARLRALEGDGVQDEQLEALARALAQEADVYQQLLERSERRADRQEATQGERLAQVGFVVLCGTPLVVLIAASLGRGLRAAPELAVAALGLGLAVLAVTLTPRASRAVARLASEEWRLVLRARRQAARLRRALGG